MARLPPVTRDTELFSRADLSRAARLLLVRSRREATSAFAGGYRSAFRGGGVEFEESRPYAPGDEVRFLDWNALARTGTPYVKRFREERDQTVVIALDVSASMGFGSTGRNKAGAAAHAAALVVAAAARAGDRVGLLTFDTAVRDEIAPGRGDAHSWRILRSLVGAAEASAGGTGLAAALSRVRAGLGRRSVVLVVSDFRDDRFFEAPGAGRPPRAELVALARVHDVVAVVVYDPREDQIPPVGALRLVDPESPGRTLVFSSRSQRARARYRTACEVRRRALARRLRGDGADVLLLRADREPLRAWARFFAFHAAQRARASR
jgi:uncharacterized protein (DUF58 family)